MVRSDDRITLRSYRLAFDLERRLHRIDRFRIPVPYGIPLVGLGYAAAIVVLLVSLGRMPLVGPMLALVPLPVRLIVVPTLGAHLLCRMRSDGRRAHEALAARLVSFARPRSYVGVQPSPRRHRARLQDLTIAPDEAQPAYRRGRIRGPAMVLLRQPARARIRRNALELEQVKDDPMFRGREVRLRSGQRLVLK